jgi:hypothetical protein
MREPLSEKSTYSTLFQPSSCWRTVITFHELSTNPCRSPLNANKTAHKTVSSHLSKPRTHCTTENCLRCTQRAKHSYKGLSKSISTSIQDNLDPYIKTIHQDGPLYFKYLMLKVASNPSSKAEACNIRQTLWRLQLAKQLKLVQNNVKSFNLHVHLQLEELASYTTDQKEDLDMDLMATY